MSVLRHIVSQDAVEPERRQEQRDGGEQAEGAGHGPGERHRARQHLLHRPDAGEGDVRVELPQDAAQRHGQRSGVASGARGDAHGQRWTLRVREVNDHRRFRVQTRDLHVAHHPHDLEGGGLAQVHRDLTAKGVPVREQGAAHRLVDDDDRGRGLGVR